MIRIMLCLSIALNVVLISYIAYEEYRRYVVLSELKMELKILESHGLL